MKTKDRIIRLLKEKKKLSGTDIANILGISKQAVNKHLKSLIESGIIRKTGSTRNAKYFISNGHNKTPLKVKKLVKLDSTSEDKVFNEIKLLLNIRKNLIRNVFEIFHYAFTEILNNAIEHSRSDKCSINVELNDYNVSFLIRDFGIGIFHSIASKFSLNDESESLIELSKGKRTTKREKHTGEGIFFTSKSCDIMKIRSHNLILIFDNIKKDVFFSRKRYLKGTEIYFSIKRFSNKKIEDFFSEFAPEKFNYKFERTKVHIELLQKEYISRSEAKRLIVGLEKFKEIIFDFKGVEIIGQGFADEIFRVFKAEHPDIDLQMINITPEIEKIIKHIDKG